MNTHSLKQVISQKSKQGVVVLTEQQIYLLGHKKVTDNEWTKKLEGQVWRFCFLPQPVKNCHYCILPEADFPKSVELSFEFSEDGKTISINKKTFTVFTIESPEEINDVDGLKDLDLYDKKLGSIFKKKTETIRSEKNKFIFENLEFSDDKEAELHIPDKPPVEELKVSEDDLKSRNKKVDLLNVQIPKTGKDKTWYYPTLEFSNLITKKDPTSFWFLSDLTFKNVHSFWADLQHYYEQNPKDLQQILGNYAASGDLPIFTSVYEQIHLNQKKPVFLDKLREKIADLRHKHEGLDQYIFNLQKKLKDSGVVAEKNPGFLEALSQRGEIFQSLEVAKFNLSNFEKKIESFLEKPVNFQVAFYINIFGKQTILSKYDEMIGDKLISLNEQINEIIFYYQQFEKTLIQKLQMVHDARKTKAKIQFFEAEEKVNDYLARQKKNDSDLTHAKRKQFLSDMGELHESSADIQQKINDEYNRINYYLNNLNSIEDIADYEKRTLEIKQKKKDLDSKKTEFEKYLFHVRNKLSVIEKSYKQFFSESCEMVSNFQEEVMSLYQNNQSLITLSTDRLWKEWNTKGLEVIEKIFTKNKEIIAEFSDFVFLQIKNLKLHQNQQLFKAQARQKEWNRVFEEIKQEYKLLGYYKEKSSPSQLDGKYIKELQTKALKLSNDTKKLIYYQPNLQLRTQPNPLLGLEPKTLDDDAFLVIDQVWSTLTEEQEEELKKKIKNESDAEDKQTTEQRLREIKDKLHERLSQEKYSFKKADVLDCINRKHTNEETKENMKNYESQLFHAWKEQNFTDSETTAQFKESIFNFAKQLFSLKKVHMKNTQVEISDTGLLSDKDTEVFTDKDYFEKKKDSDDFAFSQTLPDLSIDDDETYDVDEDDYLELIDTFDEIDQESSKYKPPSPPSLEEWAQLSIKKFREKRQFIELDDVKNKLLKLDEEIKKLNEINQKHIDNATLETEKRNYLFNEMQKDLKNVQDYLHDQEKELKIIFSSVSDELNQSFDLLDKSIK